MIDAVIVEDDFANRKLIGILMTKEGWKVREAEGGEEALSFIAEKRPNVLVTDINMPSMTGLELMRRVQKVYPGLTVIALTSDQWDREKLLSEGFDEVLDKPLDKEKLEKVLSQIQNKE